MKNFLLSLLSTIMLMLLCSAHTYAGQTAEELPKETQNPVVGQSAKDGALFAEPRLESPAFRHSPRLNTVKKYAEVAGYEMMIKFKRVRPPAKKRTGSRTKKTRV